MTNALAFGYSKDRGVGRFMKVYMPDQWFGLPKYNLLCEQVQIYLKFLPLSVLFMSSG